MKIPIEDDWLILSIKTGLIDNHKKAFLEEIEEEKIRHKKALDNISRQYKLLTLLIILLTIYFIIG
jgi:hypothetical protein